VEKVDLKKELKHLYSPSAKEVALVDVPEMSFLAIDGAGYPGTSQEYQDAMMALYGVTYTLKFSLKNDVGDFTVMPLEGLWWAGDMAAFAQEARKDEWKWTSMIALPDFVTQEHVDDAKGQLLEKRGNVPGLEKLRLERFAEGLSMQTMHIGPYSEETPNIQRLHAYMDEHGYTFNGKHHEIYLGDPRRTKPERLKTVIRQPVKEK